MSRRTKLWLGTEILLTYVLARWHLRHGPLPGVVSRLRRVDSTRLRALDAERGASLGRAVGQTLSLLPLDSRCLLRSLVLLRLLARRGEAADLVIAARPGEEEGFHAHAWVEMGGRPVLPPAGAPYGRLVTL